MKRNNSLANFTSAITALTASGGALVLFGLLALFSNRMDFLTSVLGASLIYLGSGLIGLGIFGAFLRITAKAIIEGLGGNLEVREPDVSSSFSSNQGSVSGFSGAKEQLSSTLSTGSSDSWQQLSGKEYKAWIAAGQPDLAPWDEAGRPDFLSWLQKNS